MPRLRRADCSSPGITRRRCGTGFSYANPDGSIVADDATLERIADLGIPPAWTDVWICTDANGHLQCLGTDAAGRRQYLYHARWRARRDREKFERMLEFAATLPALRERTEYDLAASSEPTRERVLAGAMRLLDRGLFRVGSEQYADDNNTYGLATLRKEHVHMAPPFIVFDYPAKSGRQRTQSIADKGLFALVGQLKRRRSGGDELLAYRTAQRCWCDVRSADINDYLKQATGGEFTAKDFRTWHATVLCSMALAIADTSGPRSPSANKRLIAHAVRETAHYLGNTPAVCRASYIDSRVFDRFEAGATIAPAIDRLHALDEIEQPAVQQVVEAAVLELLSGRSERAIARRAEREIEQLAS